MPVILRLPSFNLVQWTTRCTAEDNICLTTLSGMFALAIITMVSRREKASCAEFA